MLKRVFYEAPIILLLVVWAWLLLKCDDAMLCVVIPYMLGSYDWIHYFFR